MSAHTPEQWLFDAVELDVSKLVDPENSPNYYAPICQLDDEWTPEIVAAHGRLIASAPKLLSILQRLVSLCPSNEGMGGHAPIAAFIQLGEAARAAIRKVTGESA